MLLIFVSSVPRIEGFDITLSSPALISPTFISFVTVALSSAPPPELLLELELEELDDDEELLLELEELDDDEELEEEPHVELPVTVKVNALALSPRLNVTAFVPVKHVVCATVQENDFVLPALTVVPELDVGSLPERVRPEAADIEYEVRILEPWEFWTFTSSVVDWPSRRVAADLEPVTLRDDGATNSIVSVVEDLEPPDHVSVTLYVYVSATPALNVKVLLVPEVETVEV